MSLIGVLERKLWYCFIVNKGPTWLIDFWEWIDKRVHSSWYMNLKYVIIRKHTRFFLKKIQIIERTHVLQVINNQPQVFPISLLEVVSRETQKNYVIPREIGICLKQKKNLDRKTIVRIRQKKYFPNPCSFSNLH